MNEVWDWVRESKIWEVIDEQFETWALAMEDQKKKDKIALPIKFGS